MFAADTNANRGILQRGSDRELRAERASKCCKAFVHIGLAHPPCHPRRLSQTIKAPASQTMRTMRHFTLQALHTFHRLVFARKGCTEANSLSSSLAPHDHTPAAHNATLFIRHGRCSRAPRCMTGGDEHPHREHVPHKHSCVRPRGKQYCNHEPDHAFRCRTNHV